MATNITLVCRTIIEKAPIREEKKYHFFFDKRIINKIVVRDNVSV